MAKEELTRVDSLLSELVRDAILPVSHARILFRLSLRSELIIQSVVSQSIQRDLIPRIQAVSCGSIEGSVAYLSQLCDIVEDYQSTLRSLSLYQSGSDFERTTVRQLGNVLNPLLDGVGVECWRDSQDLYPSIAFVSKQRMRNLLQGASESTSSDDTLHRVSQFVSSDLFQRLLFSCLSSMLNAEDRFPDVSVLIPWFSSLFASSHAGSSRPIDYPSLFKEMESAFFNHHLVQIVLNYPSSLEFVTIRGDECCSDASLSPYLANLASHLQQCKHTDDIITFYTKLIHVCDDLSLAAPYRRHLLLPVQEAIRSRSDWVQSVFLVISRDVPVRPPSAAHP